MKATNIIFNSDHAIVNVNNEQNIQIYTSIITRDITGIDGLINQSCKYFSDILEIVIKNKCAQIIDLISFCCCITSDNNLLLKKCIINFRNMRERNICKLLLLFFFQNFDLVH